ncbi:glycosyltransferase family 2 protein [Pedobacter sp. L105]|uniref:glycosyltransferase family 2 protein n=1 Tax=Pedobacter sp. L105 TaxID=1641871 RepID=UPI001C201B34|nr:glycosyltransferase [Pedobacter sp. L105]
MDIQTITAIDVIILSYAHTNELMQTTINCINSLQTSEDSSKIKFNILVMESQKDLGNYQYPFSKTIYPDQPFGYHTYMNLGIEMTNAAYICLCNNDLIFHPNWASEILKTMNQIPDLLSASPICSILHPNHGFDLYSGIKQGYRIGLEIAGWCLFMRRELFQLTGKLDENFTFNSADYDYANTLAVLNIKHALITSSIVDHLYNTTVNTHSKERQEELNITDYYYFKWSHRLLPF